MEELFLGTLTSTGRRQNSHPITTSVITSVSKVDLTELYDALEGMTWHMPGAFQYACSVNNIKEVKVPPDCTVLTGDCTEHYQEDDLFGPYWDRLVKESVLDISGMEYVLHQGKVRAQGTVCVPLSVMAKVCKATHTFAQPGVDRTVEMVDRQYNFTVPKRPWSDLISAMVKGCPVCQASKHRRGTEPEYNQPYLILEYPFSSVCIDFCNLTSDPCTHRNTEYDYVLIVVCRLTGYVIAVPCQKTLTSQHLAVILLERVVEFAGLRQTFFTDNDHFIHAKLFTTLCSQAGIDVKKSQIYRPRSNGRAERAVQTVIAALRKILMQTKKKNWVQLLPLAVCTSNDIPGVVSGYSIHYLLFGRNPIGFGDSPPVFPEHESVGAVEFFKQLIADQTFVQEKLQAQYDKLAKQFLKKHPTHVYKPGDKVWSKGHTKDGNSKLHRVWTSPGEILARIGKNQYTVATDKGEINLNTMRLKLLMSPHTEPADGEHAAPLHYYTNQEFLVETDKYVVEKVSDHKPKRATSREQRKGLVKYKGYPDPESQPASSFMHDIDEDCLA